MKEHCISSSVVTLLQILQKFGFHTKCTFENEIPPLSKQTIVHGGKFSCALQVENQTNLCDEYSYSVPSVIGGVFLFCCR